MTYEREPLQAISSVDGRYRGVTEPLAEYFSEYALIRARCRVECEYLVALSETTELGVRALKPEEKHTLRSLAALSLEDARIIKTIETDGYEKIPATNHDVKAVEYFLKMRLKGTSLEDVSEWVHFALTSEDVNSVAYGLLLRDAIEGAMLPMLENVEQPLSALAEKEAATPMLARTHGQSASPTTFGKEMLVFVTRLRRQVDALKASSILVKCGGATGNYNAHMVAVPGVDWLTFSKTFIESFNAEGADTKHYVRVALNDVTTQIEPHDTYAELFDAMRRVNVILMDFSMDLWRYISDGWVAQRPVEGEIGSSAMPHKVNPIDFENAEGNLGVANALFNHFSNKLPISRLQRDLSDSTVERVFGTAFAHSFIAYAALAKGLGKIQVNAPALKAALDEHPEVLSEAIQTVLRREGVAVPYEQLKELTRGKKVTLEDFAVFIDALSVSDEVKGRLKALRPENYIGIAERIVKGK